jgi:hypothetical protein
MSLLDKLLNRSPDAAPLGPKPKNCNWCPNCECGHSLSAHISGECCSTGITTEGYTTTGCTCTKFKVRGWVAYA